MKYIIRAVKDCLYYLKKYYALYTLEKILLVAEQFLNVLFIGNVLQKIADQSYDHIVESIVLFLATIGGIKILLFCLRPIIAGQETLATRFIFSRHYEKVSRLPFQEADNHETQLKVEKLSQIQVNSSASLYSIFEKVRRGIGAMVSVASAIFFALPIFSSSDSRSSHFLLTPWAYSVLLIVLGGSIAFHFLLLKGMSHMLNDNSDEVRKRNSIYFYETGLLRSGAHVTKEARLYQQVKNIRKRGKETTNYFYSVSKRFYYMDNASEFIAQSMSTIANGYTYMLIAVRVINGLLPIGQVLQVANAIRVLFDGVAEITQAAFISEVHYLKEYYEFLDKEEEVVAGSLPVEKRLDNDYLLSTQHLSFAYTKEEKPVLQDITANFEVGKKYAIVGENGSGKSTFIKVLMRLYEPTSGAVLLNDIDTRKYDRSEYYSLFSVVFQDFKLLDFTVGQNVSVQTLYDAHKIDTIFKQLGLSNWAKKLKNGYDTYLGTGYSQEGIHASGGQMQKIAMARAIYKDAPIMILDEPTAALDPVAEFEIYQQFADIAQDKTAFYISHRLSSCRFCDEILVFDKGRIVQRGAHQELVNTEGKYKQLWDAQAQYYQ